MLSAGVQGQLVQQVVQPPATMRAAPNLTAPKEFPASTIVLAPMMRRDPFAILGLIDKSELKPGDILVSTEEAGISKNIRDVTRAAYSHAALYVGDGKIIDATKAGVTKRDLSALTDPASRVGVIRVDQLTDKARDKVLATANKLVGKSYNYLGMVFGIVGELKPSLRLQRLLQGEPFKVTGSTFGFGYFCSELVIKSYATAGIHVAADPADSPGGIIDFAQARPRAFQLVGRLDVGKG